ncbi:MAG: hypothetical protein KDK60_04035 [Chlamydiia bacterium]|nr:hypothetical protein [Chlamydiia bacterium]
MRIHFINVVWGKKYVETFLRISLPTQLAEGNLPGLKERGDIHYYLFTTEEDKEVIQSSPLYELLRKHVTFHFKLIKLLKGRQHHNLLTGFHIQAIKEADPLNAAMIFLSPDCIFSTGVFSKFVSLLEKGKRLVVGAGIRITLEGVKEELSKQGELDKNQPIELSPEHLSKIAIPNLHHLTRGLFWNNEKIDTHSTHLYWKLDDETILLRPFHIHPFVVWPTVRGVFPCNTIDGPYTGKVVPCREDWEIMTDYSQATVFEMSSEAQFLESRKYKKPSILEMSAFIRRCTTPAHRYFATQKLIIGYGKRKKSWEKVEKSSDRVIFGILNSSPLYYIKVFFYGLFVKMWWYTKTSTLILIGKKKFTIEKFMNHFFPNRRQVE